ncbi:MAG: CRISPR-associated ring nuclease Csm6 [Sulfuricaulis sp.]
MRVTEDKPGTTPASGYSSKTMFQRDVSVIRQSQRSEYEYKKGIMLPHQYNRRILLAVTGLSPQIVTETLYALTQKQTPAFVPTEIHLITTSQGAENARLNLLSEAKGWFHRLRRDYQLPNIAFTAEHIHAIPSVGGSLSDIRTPEDNERAADYITDTVRRLTADTDSALHVSIAGGRKTMGYYLGYALSLYGREQDCLSHVLVSAPFENNPEFYYPTPYEQPIDVRQGEKTVAYDARSAGVDLAVIPFVRMRAGLPKRLLEGQARLTEIVAAANRAQQPPRLVLDTTTLSVFADDQRIETSPTEFAVLLWFAHRVRADEPEIDWSTEEAANEFLATAQQIINAMSGEYQRIEEAIDWRSPSTIKTARYFEPHKSRINSTFVHTLGETAAARYAIARGGPRGQSRYFLPLMSNQIEIRQ